MEHPNTSYDFPIVWEDVLAVTDELQHQISYLEKEHEDLLDDFCDLISILIDSGELSNPVKELITNRFLKPKNK